MEASSTKLVVELAGKLYDAVRSIDPDAVVQGDPRKGYLTLIDGTFNLSLLVRLVVTESCEMHRRTSP